MGVPLWMCLLSAITRSTARWQHEATVLDMPKKELEQLGHRTTSRPKRMMALPLDGSEGRYGGGAGSPLDDAVTFIHKMRAAVSHPKMARSSRLRFLFCTRPLTPSSTHFPTRWVLPRTNFSCGGRRKPVEMRCIAKRRSFSKEEGQLRCKVSGTWARSTLCISHTVDSFKTLTHSSIESSRAMVVPVMKLLALLVPQLSNYQLISPVQVANRPWVQDFQQSSKISFLVSIENQWMSLFSPFDWRAFWALREPKHISHYGR